jgi:hypothetical protein
MLLTKTKGPEDCLASTPRRNAADGLRTHRCRGGQVASRAARSPSPATETDLSCTRSATANASTTQRSRRFRRRDLDTGRLGGVIRRHLVLPWLAVSLLQCAVGILCSRFRNPRGCGHQGDRAVRRRRGDQCGPGLEASAASSSMTCSVSSPTWPRMLEPGLDAFDASPEQPLPGPHDLDAGLAARSSWPRLPPS